jgi:GNAT superfamily N-acetyltransferase
VAPIASGGSVIRAFRATDLGGALAANDAVGWSGRRGLFDYYSARGDCGLFVAEVDGEIVGTGGATIFPGAPPTGWVHGIVVRPGRQRSGIGRRLTEAAIAWLRARSAGAVLLLAADAGRPVYERLGFVAGERYGSFAWPAVSASASTPVSAVSEDPGTRGGGVVTRPMLGADLPAVCALDHAATGEDRRGFIEPFVSSGWVATSGGDVVGFHLACPWGGGPTVARDAATGLALLRLAAVVRRAPRSLGLPAANEAAVHHLSRLGITAERYATRMWLGAPPPWRPDMIFGVFNFAVA